jgi:anti-sigma-K factor RskA
VLVAAVVGLAAWNITLQRGGHSEQFAARATLVKPLTSTTGASGTVIYYGDAHKAIVVTSGLPPLDASKQTYQLWAIAAGRPRSLGTMQTDEGGSGVTVVALDTAGVDTIAMTVEPAGGSDQPTSSPIMSAPV